MIDDFFRRASRRIRSIAGLAPARSGYTSHAVPVRSGRNHAITSVLEANVVGSLEEYKKFNCAMQSEYARRAAVELNLIGEEDVFTTAARCYVCDKPSVFVSDFLYSDGTMQQGKKIPNWRERALCRGCNLNTRMRGCIHFLEQNLACTEDAVIYISEQNTSLYRYLALNYPHVIGSEYFGSRIPYGSTDPVSGFRNESVTGLTFADAKLDFMLSFDVFEHVPDYVAAFRECYRCLKPDGELLFSIPFNVDSASTQAHAKVDENGHITHLTAPVYHADPVNPEGCLCFHTFGWDILEQLRAIGFTSANIHFYWSEEFSYLGHEQILMTATK